MEYHVDRMEQDHQHTAVVRATTGVEGIAAFLGEAFGEIMGQVQAQHAVVTGPPFARYTMLQDGFVVEAGFPVAEPITAAGRVIPAELPAGLAVVVLHRGPYQAVAAAYDAAQAWVTEHDWEVTGDPWEAYLDDPEVPEPRTVVHLPARPR